MPEWIPDLLVVLLFLAFGGGIGYSLSQWQCARDLARLRLLLDLERQRSLCRRWQRALKMDEDEWPAEEDDLSLPQCVTCVFYTLPAEGNWCPMFKDPPEVEGGCKQWRGKEE